jgi:asparagine synthase (glutamine-hydrolysing)
LWAAESGDVVFAHRRLAILDLSEAGAQPMVEAESGCAITFNGEVYNFREIRRELESVGERFASSSDTEVVLKAYKKWGLETIPRLRGIFAMAIFDPRLRVVHLVRDQLGVKPLYWTVTRAGHLGRAVFLFASEVRALLSSGLVERKLDPAGVASYLSQGFVVGPGTIVDGVNLLPAGSTMTVSLDEEGFAAPSHRTHRYWSLPAARVRETAEEELREELVRAVRMQLVSDAPLGIFLSGGVDSSAVAVLASGAVPDSVHTFTISFDEPRFDESQYARCIADAIGSRHTTAVLREDHFVQDLPRAFSAIDQPTFDGLNTYFVSKAAREAGMTVALAGTGGDELFGGYSSYVDVPRALDGTAWLPKRGMDSVLNGASAAGSSLFWNVLRHAPPQTRWGKIMDVARAAHDLVGMYQVSYELFTADTQRRLALRVVRDAQSRQCFGLPQEVAESWREDARGSQLLHAISLLELKSFIGERLLRDTDAASMAVALEVRVPLLDPVLCEAVAAVAADRRFKPIRKKQLLRDLALGGLDPAIFDRPKAGFVLPIDEWARRRLRQDMDGVLADGELAGRVGLCARTVRTLWRSYLAGKPGLHWSRVWSLYVLLAWCKEHEMTIAS